MTVSYKMLISGCLFHSSGNTNLEEISPRPSGAYANRGLVFAARIPAISAVFLHNIGKDITCRFRMDGDVPRLVEQYDGAFETRYPEDPGAIYVVPAAPFTWARDMFPNENRWAEDYISVSPVRPIEKIYIPNVRTYILDLVEKGRVGLERHTQGKALEQHLEEFCSQFHTPGSLAFQNQYNNLHRMLRG